MCSTAGLSFSTSCRTGSLMTSPTPCRPLVSVTPPPHPLQYTAYPAAVNLFWPSRLVSRNPTTSRSFCRQDLQYLLGMVKTVLAVEGQGTEVESARDKFAHSSLQSSGSLHRSVTRCVSPSWQVLKLRLRGVSTWAGSRVIRTATNYDHRVHSQALNNSCGTSAPVSEVLLRHHLRTARPR